MRLVCPACGAVASAEAWANEPLIRQSVDVLAKMPGGIGGHALAYIALFRDPESSRGMAWKKALRLLTELRDLIAAGHIQWKGKPSRPAPPLVWLNAIEQMIQRPPSDLPIGNHRYLQKIVYYNANAVDKQAEIDRNSAWNRRTIAQARETMETPRKMTKEEMRRIREKYLPKRRKPIGEQKENEK